MGTQRRPKGRYPYCGRELENPPVCTLAVGRNPPCPNELEKPPAEPPLEALELLSPVAEAPKRPALAFPTLTLLAVDPGRFHQIIIGLRIYLQPSSYRTGGGGSVAERPTPERPRRASPA